jgi:hypothetical protein
VPAGVVYDRFNDMRLNPHLRQFSDECSTQIMERPILDARFMIKPGFSPTPPGKWSIAHARDKHPVCAFDQINVIRQPGSGSIRN